MILPQAAATWQYRSWGAAPVAVVGRRVRRVVRRVVRVVVRVEG